VSIKLQQIKKEVPTINYNKIGEILQRYFDQKEEKKQETPSDKGS
jgi:hypothetical protein